MFEFIMLLCFAATGFAHLLPGTCSLKTQKKARRDTSHRARIKNQETNGTQFIRALTFSKPRL